MMTKTRTQPTALAFPRIVSVPATRSFCALSHAVR